MAAFERTILVTGGAGYIGSHACKALAVAGYVPVTFDNLSTGWRDSVKFGPFEEGDLLDRTRLDEVFERHNPTAVMHFAAHSQVGESMAEPGKYWRNNVIGSLNLAEAAVSAGCRKFIFSSTCATYGEHDNVVLDEDCPQQPTNPYGASKLAVEHILAGFAGSDGLRNVVFRYFNVAGADPEAEIGEFHRPETHLIPLALDVVRGKREQLVIYGDDYPTPDGTCIRDYVHVKDLVAGHLAGLEHLENGGTSRAFNLGTGHGFSVKDVVNQIEFQTGRKLLISVGPPRPGDCSRLVSGSTRASKELGWQPKHSDMKTMIADALRWHQMPGYER